MMTKHPANSPKPTIGLSILSWRSWNTLDAALKTHRDAGLFDHFDRAVIFFQDLCDQDIEIANRYHLDYTGGPNCGIGEGMRRAATCLATDYVLLLENDCPTIAEPNTVERELSLAIDYLERGIIDIMRIRSRLHPVPGLF